MNVASGKAKLKTSDGAHVTVELSNNNAAYSTSFVEVQGVVTSATTLREESHTDFGSSFGETYPTCQST